MAIFQRPHEPLRELALFAGGGGGILASHLLEREIICAVERDAYAAQILAQRQNDGCLRPFPIWSDVTTFDGRAWTGRIDVISGGFPCQDISAAGPGTGITGARSGLWSHMARIIGEVLPTLIELENSPLLVGRGLTTVIGDLTALGYDCRWGVLGADDIGAPHERKRFWLVANANSYGQQQCAEGWDQARYRAGYSSSELDCTKCERWPEGGHHNPEYDGLITGATDQDASKVPDTNSVGLAGPWNSRRATGSAGLRDRARTNQIQDIPNTSSIGLQGPGASWFSRDPAEDCEGETDQSWHERVGCIWGIESRLGRVAHGVAYRVDRLKAIGNGQVPAVAATAYRLLGGDVI